MNNTRGQNVIEYILLVAAIVAVCLAFLRPGGKYYRALDRSVNTTFNVIDRASQELVFPPKP